MSKTFLRLVIPEPGGPAKPPPCTNEEPELFFPVSYTGGYEHQIAQAKAVCRKCPVKLTCLEFALDTGDQHAILGGTTPTERSALQAKRAKRETRKYQKWSVEAA